MAIGLAELEDILDGDPDNIEQLQQWYGRLSEYELNGSETPNQLGILFRTAKWLMQFEHTAAEELKEVAEREAVDMAEQQEVWEQEREILKAELHELRERITNRAGIDEMNEAFRAEIDSLNAENAHLKQLSRERDRELADQRDKVEELLGRIGVFERDRSQWTSQQTHLEDTIRELNRRLSSKTEMAPRGELESRKLKQRSEQALMLGDQLRGADRQNAELRERVEQLTRALEEASALLDETTRKHEKLREQFDSANSATSRLFAENSDLRRMLETKERTLSDTQQSDQMNKTELQNLLHSRDSQLEKLREQNQKLENQIEEIREKIGMDESAEREKELERLRVELVEATELARQLFGEPLDGDRDNQTAELRLRILQLSREMNSIKENLAETEREKDRMTAMMERRDAQIARLHTEIENLRTMSFGDADNYIRDLQRQIQYRDRQISQLTLKYSLLQFDSENPKPQRSKSQPSSRKRRNRDQNRDRKRIPEKPESNGDDLSAIASSPIGSPIVSSVPPVLSTSVDIHPSSERSPLIVELIQRLEGIEWEIGEQEALRILLDNLRAAETQLTQKENQIQKLKEQIQKTEEEQRKEQNQKEETEKEVQRLREILCNPESQQSEEISRLEEMEIENLELKRFMSGVQIGGSEIERRFEESTRRLIHLGIQNRQNERNIGNSQRRIKLLCEEIQRIRTQIQRFHSKEDRRIRQINWENVNLDSKREILKERNLVEIARLQNLLLHSVPSRVYDRLLKNFKSVLSKSDSAETSDFGYESDVEPLDIMMDRESKRDVENAETLETIDILQHQNEYWHREAERRQTEIAELNAFLDDLENQTDLKTNIEKRFLHSLREQNDLFDEQISVEWELKNVRREIHSTKRRWFLDRQKLVNVIISLQMSLRRIRSKTMGSLSVSQMTAIRSAASQLSEQKTQLEIETQNLEKQKAEFEREKILTESKAESVADRSAAELQQSLYRAAFHSKTLSIELRNSQNRIQRLEKEAEIQKEENADLRKELEELSALNFDPHQFDQTEIQSEREKSSETSSRTQSPQNPTEPQRNPQRSQQPTLIIDNSEDYEKQLDSLRENAKLTISIHREEMRHKDNVIDEYKRMLNEISAQQRAESQRRTPRSPRSQSSQILSAQQIIGNDTEREKELITLRWELAEAEEANANLANRLRSALSAPTDFPIVSQTNVGIQTENAEMAEIRSDRSSDSGTVADFGEEEASRHSTRTIESRKDPNEIRTLQFHSEIRRLRQRLWTAEQKNRELSRELESLQQRNRPHRNPDPNAEVNILRKENERMRREIRNLSSSNDQKSVQITEMEKKLQKRTETVKDSLEQKTEIRAIEAELRITKQRLTESRNNIAELQNRLERREQLIEKLSRAQNNQNQQRNRKEVKKEKNTETIITEKEAVWKSEAATLNLRLRELQNQIEILLRENQKLKRRLNKPNGSTQTQTPNEWIIERKPQEPYRQRPITRTHRSTNTETQRAENRLTELRNMELNEELEEIRKDYHRLQTEYQNFKKTTRNDTVRFESISVVLLEDKLKAKERELGQQRKTIADLEYEVQKLRLSAF